MAKLLIIPLFFLSVSLFGQRNPSSDSLQNDFADRLTKLRRSMDSMINPVKYAGTLEEFLLGNFSQNSTKDGRWVYYKDNANIQKLDKPEVSKVIPSYNFYKVRLTNYLGYHVNSCSNLVLFDSVNKKMIHPEPMWYSDNNEEFIKLFIGKKFSDSTALMAFVNEFHDLLRVGSTGQFANTKYSNTKVTFDDTFEGARGTEVWRHIEVYIKDNTIVEYRSINPK
jgi:hypothetical protein